MVPLFCQGRVDPSWLVMNFVMIHRSNLYKLEASNCLGASGMNISVDQIIYMYGRTYYLTHIWLRA